MKKKSLLALVLSGSMILTGFPVSAAKAEQTGTELGGTVLTKTIISGQNGLRHYVYKDASGNIVTLKNGKKNNASKKKAGSLPSSYDSREHGTVTSIKDQGVTGSCWGFGTIKALESSAITKGLADADTIDLSENHLVWYTYHGETDKSSGVYGDSFLELDDDNAYNQGGNASVAISTLANWWGAALEEDYPFTADTYSELNDMVSSMTRTENNARYDSSYRLKEANCYDNADISEIKQAVMDYGDVNVSHYFDDQLLYRSGNEYAIYQNKRNYQYANHSVSIVGWDDNFSGFKNRPRNSGAWLIANSYGDSYPYSNEGYYWVSYYDTSLTEFYTFEAEETDQYDTNYQYDGAGYAESVDYTSDTACANIFTNTGSSPQEIKAAGIYTLADNQSYQIYVYRNISGDTPGSGEYVAAATTSGTISHAGYHTISLTNPVAIAAGETFSIIVRYNVTNEEVYIPVEGSGDATKMYNSNGNIVDYVQYSSKAGQSYIYNVKQGEWVDTTSAATEDSGGSVFFGRASKTNYNNVCLKAFGSDITTAAYEESQENYTPLYASFSALMDGTYVDESPTPVPDVPTTRDPDIISSAVPGDEPQESSVPVNSAVPTDGDLEVSATPAAEEPTVTSTPDTGYEPVITSAPDTGEWNVVYTPVPQSVSNTPAPAATSSASGSNGSQSVDSNDGTTTGDTDDDSDLNACKKVKAAKKTYTIKKKGKSVKAIFKVTCANTNKMTTDMVTVKFKNKKIAKLTGYKLAKKKLTLTVTGKKKGKTTLTVKIGKKSAKTTIKVRK